MTSALRKILVVGGNGFIGSAVCRVALARGLQVISVSSSGQPYRTAKGHTPAWVAKVDWQKGDALHPQTFAHLFPEVGGVVHTLGTLIEDGGRYKTALKKGDFLGLFGGLLPGGQTGNPLEKEADGKKMGSYEVMNRDTALRVCEAFLDSSPTDVNQNLPRPFVYLSAEDIARPVIPARYIETKWEAERRIEEMMKDRPEFRGVYIRPSLVYHAHHRPLTTPAAALLGLSATLHSKVPASLPTPSGVLRSLGSFSTPAESTTSIFDSMANALVTPPIHVDHVAEAICASLDSVNGVRGVVGVGEMRELIGWTDRGVGREVGPGRAGSVD